MKQIIGILILALSFVSLNAQNGLLKGRISDELSIGLPGANIKIKSLGKGVSTDVQGIYLLQDIPAGTYDVEVSFIGYENKTVNVKIEEGKLTSFNVSLESGVSFKGDVMVLGDRLKGQAKALNQQKSLMNITNIVASDQIGRFPDANIGDAMKRIPGITMQGDQGEARNIIIRGLAPQLNSVTLNGDRIPSAEADNRNIQLDLIPSDMIQTIEVNKALTPDMDGDAIGGSVNLVTRPAPDGFRVSVTGASGYNFLSKQPIWTGGLIVGDRFAKGKFGYILSGSINSHEFGSDNVEGEWSNQAESPLSGDDIEVKPYMSEFDVRTYEVKRIRRSLQGSLDYQLAPKHRITLRGMYNWRDDWENRYRLTYRNITPIFEDNTENVIGYEGEARRQTKGGPNNKRNNGTRLEDQRVINSSLAGDHLFGRLKVDWMASFSRASEERLQERYMRYEYGSALPLNTDFKDSRFPFVSFQNQNDAPFSDWELDEFSEENQFTQDEDMNGRLDISQPFMIASQKGSIKIGGRARLKTKYRSNDFFEITPLNGLGTLADVTTIDVSKTDFLAGEKYQAGSYVSPEFLGNLNLNDASLFEKESVPAEFLPVNYEAAEDIYAGYAMWTQNINTKFSFMAGARIESTSINYTGNELIDGEELIKQVNNKTSFSNFMPGLHLRYDATNNTVLRAAWTNTIARPNYYNLVPYRDLIEEDEEVFAGNPNLKPTTSMNFDVMADHYFKSVGILSAGVFYKKINDFIYTQQGNDALTGYDLFQAQNGGGADLTGFEFSVQRQLDFLPGFWKGFGIYFNYTFINSVADGVRTEGGDLRESVSLPGTSPHMINASLSYENKRLVLRLALNYSDSYIDELGGSDFEDRYYDKQLFLDANGSYAFTKRLRIFAEANNLTNQPLRYFQGVPARTMQMEYYNARMNIGLKYDLFNN